LSISTPPFQLPNPRARSSKFTREEYTVSGKNLVDRVGELLRKGNVTRVIVKDEAGKTLLEIPATVSVVGVVVASCLAALGVLLLWLQTAKLGLK